MQEGREGVEPWSWARRAAAVAGLVIAAPAALLTLIGFAGSRLWAYDLASSLRPQYALVLGVATAVLVLARFWGAALVVAALVGVNVATFAPLWLDNPVPPAEGSPTLRVLFHNVHGGDEERFEDVADALVAEDVDIAFVAGAPRGWVDLFVDEGPYGYVFPDSSVEHRRIFAVGRVPVTDAQHVILDEASRVRSLVLDLPLGAADLRILATHTLSPRSPARAADRNLTLARAADWARAQDGPTVVVGDLNVTPWSTVFESLLDDGDLHDSKRGFGVQPTYPAGWGPLMIPIDHLLHSDELTVVRRATGPSLGSGHRSIIVDLALAGP